MCWCLIEVVNWPQMQEQPDQAVEDRVKLLGN